MNNGLTTQELFQKLEEKIKNKEIKQEEFTDFYFKKILRAERCYVCGQEIIKEKNTQLEITSLEIHSDKIVACLNNGDRPEVPLDWFAKWGVNNVTADKLKKYEIWEGEDIYFPEIDEVLGIEKFIGGFDAPCR